MSSQLKDPEVYMTVKPNWGFSVNFRRKYVTNVITSLAGAEQRGSVSMNVRRSLSYTAETHYHAQSAYLENLLRNNRNSVWGVPVWISEMELTAQAAAGASSFSVDSTVNSRLASGESWGIIVDAYNSYEAVKVTGFTSTSVSISGELASTHASGKKFYPVMSCTLQDDPSPSFLAPKVVTVELSFLEQYVCEDA